MKACSYVCMRLAVCVNACVKRGYEMCAVLGDRIITNDWRYASVYRAIRSADFVQSNKSLFRMCCAFGIGRNSLHYYTIIIIRRCCGWRRPPVLLAFTHSSRTLSLLFSSLRLYLLYLLCVFANLFRPHQHTNTCIQRK